MGPKNVFERSLVLLILLVQGLVGADKTCNACGQIPFHVEQGIAGRYLDDGRNLKVQSVNTHSECFSECSFDCRCMSFTVCGKSCYLNAGSRKLAKNSLLLRPGCRYYDFPVFERICDSLPSPPRVCCLPGSPLCYNGATCVVNVTDTTRRFECKCPTGFYGEQCQIQNPKTCMDYWKDEIKPKSGRYTIRAQGESFEVYCDFDSEKDIAWTLFESFDLQHEHLLNYPFSQNHAIHEIRFNWELFRLPKSVMSGIASRSTFWRATCSYSVYGIDFRDYIRVRLSIMNPLEYDLKKEARKRLPVDYFDIKGTNCVNCTQTFIQSKSGKRMLHIDLQFSRRIHKCSFEISKVRHQCGEVHARLLGFYHECSDPEHRCSEKMTSTTEYWFGTTKSGTKK
ncbi:uncharacterized protein LOC114532941 [Dendronephthya gigantea]|uniref:uncharacterized protein LOC114532941 n=1 Tax=Dendronephthya gigantea TaxID=151771 RepID=UPI00106920A6|nr:uncharacterized protein LOC114532941 [Dendronephthya gigantea]